MQENHVRKTMQKYVFYIISWGQQDCCYSGLRCEWVILVQARHWLAFARKALSWESTVWSENSVLGVENCNIGLLDNNKLIKFQNQYSEWHSISCLTKIITENLRLTYFSCRETYVSMAWSIFFPDSDCYQLEMHRATCKMKEVMIYCWNPMKQNNPVSLKYPTNVFIPWVMHY